MRAYQSFDWFEIKLLEIGGKEHLKKMWTCFILSQRVILLKNLLLDLSTQEETLPNAYNVPQSS